MKLAHAACYLIVIACRIVYNTSQGNDHRLLPSAKTCVKIQKDVVLLENPFHIEDFSTEAKCEELCKNWNSKDDHDCITALFFYNEDKCNLFQEEPSEDNIIDGGGEKSSKLFNFRKGKDCEKEEETKKDKEIEPKPEKKPKPKPTEKPKKQKEKNTKPRPTLKPKQNEKQNKVSGQPNKPNKKNENLKVTKTVTSAPKPTEAPTKPSTVRFFLTPKENPTTKSYRKPTEQAPSGFILAHLTKPKRNRVFISRNRPSATAPPRKPSDTRSNASLVYYICPRSRLGTCNLCIGSGCETHKAIGNAVLSNRKTCCRLCSC